MTERILFVGSKRQGLAVLQALLSWVPTAVVGCLTVDDHEDARSAAPELQQACATAGVPLWFSCPFYSVEQVIEEVQPTTLLVCCWYRLFSPEVLATVQGRVYGWHNSLLPAYRGSAPVVWAMLHNDFVGVSLFRITAGIDDGPVLASRQVPCGADDYVGQVLPRLEQASVELLNRFMAGERKEREQDGAAATYGAPRRPADGLLNWVGPRHSILAAIRAQSHPYPGAFSYWQGKQVHIWRAWPFPYPYYGLPGQLVRHGDDTLACCGDSWALVLEELTIHGQPIEPQALKGRLQRRG